MLDLRLPDELADRLASIAKVEGRSSTDVAVDAVRSYIDSVDEAYRAEARRQSRAAADRGWTQEDHYWESVAAFDTAEPPAATNAAE